mmetsp:Transcript_22429/g.34048  ORF Transcript_22429/g.34048 Transcript_22429/m.34048 type:complete len:115 (-) Transcript_22429:264-608(-)
MRATRIYRQNATFCGKKLGPALSVANTCVFAPFAGGRFLSTSDEERDVEVVKTEKQFVALLRRVADAVEENQSWRVQVDKVRLTVPEDAAVTVEHEVEDGHHNIELQFRWPTKK